MSVTSPLALVTGASSGIGRAFAQRLAATGHDLVVVARRAERLEELAASLPGVEVEVVVADLSTDAGLERVTDLVAQRDVDVLVNNAGLAHYQPFDQLPPDQARELVGVKVLTPTLLARAVVPGMLERGHGTIVNVAGMIAFSGPAAAAPPPGRRAVYTGTLAYLVAMTQTLHAEMESAGIGVHVVCPGVVATEFHSVQGMDLSSMPRMSADDVVTATLAGIARGEVVITPGVEDHALLEAVFAADLEAFGAQSPYLATRYVTGESH